MLNAEFFGLTVDALASGALGVDGVVQGAIAVQGHTLKSAQFPVGVFLTALAFEKLLMVTGGSGGLREEQGAEKTVRLIAIGMMELEGGGHAQAFGTHGDAIVISRPIVMSMLVDWHGPDAAMPCGGLVDIPGIKGSDGGRLMLGQFRPRQ